MRLKEIGQAALCALLLASCGSAHKPPNDEMTQARAVVRAAEEVGAKDVPQAALHFKMANDQIVSAEVLIAKEEMKKARDLLLRAEVDAELAIALTKAVQKADAAQAATSKVQTLEKDKR